MRRRAAGAGTAGVSAGDHFTPPRAGRWCRLAGGEGGNDVDGSTQQAKREAETMKRGLWRAAPRAF